MNMNKNVSIWRGDDTPPTQFHLWLKGDKLYHSSNLGWEENKIDLASIEKDGLMSKEDKKRLDNLVYDGLDNIIYDGLDSEDDSKALSAKLGNILLNKILELNLSVYKPKGSVNSFEELPVLDLRIGDVYNIVNQFYIEGKKYPAGTNVVWIGSKWDSLGGTVDFSDYSTTEQVEVLYSELNSKLSEYQNNTNQLIEEKSLEATAALAAEVARASKQESNLSTSISDLNLSLITESSRATAAEEALRTSKVDKVEGKSLVSDDQIVKLTNLNNQDDITSNIADAKKAGTDALFSLDSHTSNVSNPHNVTKNLIGLGNVDNTSDLNKPISTAVQTALDGKLSTSVTTMPNPNSIKVQVKEVDLIEYDGSAVKTINLTSSDNITITSLGSTITIGGGTYSEATNTKNGLMSSTDKAKLDNIESGAQINSITGVKGNAEGSYRTGNVNITPTNIGLGNVNNTSDLSKPISTATQEALDVKVDKIAGKGLSTEDFTGAYKTVLDNLPTNYAPLVDGLVPAANLPSYVDDVIESESKNKFPTTGESGKIYVALDTNLTYRWGGTEYVEISKSLALGETASTAYAGDKGAANATAIATHTGNTNNPHGVTKSQIGLSNVDNTSDLNKPVSTATQTELNKKVDKVEGKGLSTEDYTTADKTKLAGIASGAQVNSITGVKGGAEESYRTGNVNITAANLGLGNVNNTSDADKPISTAQLAAIDEKVDKVAGKGLSTNDYTTDERNKLAGIAAGALVNVIESVKINGTALAISNKEIDIPVPTKLSLLTNDIYEVATSAEITAILNGNNI